MGLRFRFEGVGLSVYTPPEPAWSRQKAMAFKIEVSRVMWFIVL